MRQPAREGLYNLLAQCENFSFRHFLDCVKVNLRKLISHCTPFRYWCMIRQASRRLARLKTYLWKTQNKDKKEFVAKNYEL